MCICQEIKCPDYSTDDGEPAWCYRAGCPANIAVAKCSKVTDNLATEQITEEKP